MAEPYKYKERAVRPLELERAEVEQLMHLFAPGGRVQAIETLTGGASNTTLKVQYENLWYVLRFFTRDPKLALVEEAIYQKLEGSSFLPKRVFSALEHNPHPFALFTFCEKPSIYTASKKQGSTLCYELGKTLANIHAVHFDQAGLFGKGLQIEKAFEQGSSPYYEYLETLLNPQSLAWNRLGEQRASKLSAFIKDNQAFFPKVDVGGQLIHSDFKPVNLLWQDSLGVTVLDWEFAHSGHPLMDFAILMRHYQDIPWDTPALKQGYLDHGGQLPTDWIHKARITDITNMVDLLNRVEKRPQLFAVLIESIELTCLKWDRLEKVIA